MKFYSFAAAAAAAAIVAVAPASAATVFNANLAAPGVYYGDGNDYAPNNNFAVTTANGVELALRAHVGGAVAPASDSVGVYSFATGLDLNFAWSINPSINGTRITSLTSKLVITNLNNGKTASFDPRTSPDDPGEAPPGGVQNSWPMGTFSINISWLYGDIDYDKNTNASYKLSWDVGGSVAPMNTTIYIKQGTGGSGASLLPTAPVPEASTWAMMLAGFGAVGYSFRTRRRQTLRQAV